MPCWQMRSSRRACRAATGGAAARRSRRAWGGTPACAVRQPCAATLDPTAYPLVPSGARAAPGAVPGQARCGSLPFCPNPYSLIPNTACSLGLCLGMQRCGGLAPVRAAFSRAVLPYAHGAESCIGFTLVCQYCLSHVINKGGDCFFLEGPATVSLPQPMATPLLLHASTAADGTSMGRRRCGCGGAMGAHERQGDWAQPLLRGRPPSA